MDRGIPWGPCGPKDSCRNCMLVGSPPSPLSRHRRSLAGRRAWYLLWFFRRNLHILATKVLFCLNKSNGQRGGGGVGWLVCINCVCIVYLPLYFSICLWQRYDTLMQGGKSSHFLVITCIPLLPSVQSSTNSKPSIHPAIEKNLHY